MWEGKYVRALKRGPMGICRAASATSARSSSSPSIEGKVILIDQPRVAVGGRCLELPAGLVGDEDPSATVEDTAVKELEEETGFTAERVERLGDFYASPGMVAESFTLVRAHGVTRSRRGRRHRA